MKRAISLMSLSALLLSGCGQTVEATPVKQEAQVETSKTETETEQADLPPIEVKEVENANEALFNLGKAIILSEETNENIMISPLSIERCFALAIEGADEETKDQLVKAVYSNLDFDKTSSDISEAIDKVGTYESVDYKENIFGGYDEIKETKNVFKVANSIWANSDDPKLKMRKDYIDAVKNKYNAEANDIPFSNGPKPINDWVNTNTDGMIPSILQQLTKDNRVVLVNATMFESRWLDKFDVLNEKQEFTDSLGNKSDVDFMESFGDDTYLEIAGRKAFKKKYWNRFKYVGILPNKNETAEELLESLSYNDINEAVENYYKDCDLSLTFPKYTYDYDTSLVNVFKRLGVERAFTDDAQFPKMCEEPVKISDIIHKTHIELDENGTKAAAVTAMTMDACMASLEQPPVVELTFDRPFVYLIMTDDNLPAFIGIVNTITED